jgi:hypothetical protein
MRYDGRSAYTWVNYGERNHSVSAQTHNHWSYSQTATFHLGHHRLIKILFHIKIYRSH